MNYSPIDKVENEYVPINGSQNVVHEWPKNYGGTQRDPGIKAFLEPLITALAKRNPQWVFVFRGGNPAELHAATVYFKAEALGAITMGTRNSESVFAMSSPPLEAKRKRGMWEHTKDIKKAAKIISKSFIPKSVNEIVKEKFEALTGSLWSSSRDKEIKEESVYGHICTKLKNHIRTHWDDILPVLTVNGANSEALRYLDFHREREISSGINAQFTKNKGWVVHLRGEDYIFGVPRKGNIITTKPREALTDHERKCIGMLKLAQPTQFIDGVGYKLDNETFFIVEEPSETK